MNDFAKQFQKALNEELKDFNKHVMVHDTDDEREKAFHKWIKANPEKAVFKLSFDWVYTCRMPFDDLYVKIKCPTCRGTRMHNRGYHDPQAPHKWKACAYCDHKGEILIEASNYAIVQYILTLSDERRLDILKAIIKKED